MVKIVAQLTPAWRRANERAIANAKAGRRAVRVADYTYHVPSAHGDQSYVVVIHSIIKLDATCSCINGQQSGAHSVCWHKSSAINEACKRIAEVETFMRRFSKQ